MSKKLRILIIAGVMAGIGVVLVLLTHKSPGKENGVMSRQEAERRVQELKEKVKVPIDKETREKVDELIKELALEHKFVEIEGQTSSVANEANAKLRRIGRVAITQLLDAAVEDSNPEVRQRAVAIIYMLIKGGEGSKLLEYLPVFVRSTYDEDVEVRGTATAQIANMARRFYKRKRQQELDQVIPYLVKALGDKEGRTQALVGNTLFTIGRKDLVPEELIKRHKIGEIIITYGPD